MQSDLQVYNSLTRKKEYFVPLKHPFVGIYLCGPTVYGDAHPGHARSALCFDIIRRYLTYLGYKVRYVRNITDVGHLENEAEESGEDKIAKKAKLEQLEPMEVVEYYTSAYRRNLEKLNILPPSIEPRATGHIVEQIEAVKAILKKGFAYEVNGSIYFDTRKYQASSDQPYGILSGRVLDELMTDTRELEGQGEKKSAVDFALWKKASPEHIMRWPSPWGEGFPGWHLECTVMSTKYLGEEFDIHGGGMDLLFPHHECEIAQANVCNGHIPAKYWLHNNMVTINGQKMSKSLGNFIPLEQLYTGDHPLLSQAYSPMTIRYFLLQAHYRSTVDFSEDALKAAHKGYIRLMNGLKILDKLFYDSNLSQEINETLEREIEQHVRECHEGMNDDFNTAVTLAALSGLLKKINFFYSGGVALSTIKEETFRRMREAYKVFLTDILGLIPENLVPESVVGDMMVLYAQAKEERNFERIDFIRASLKKQGILVKDTKKGPDWGYDEQ